MRRNVNLGRIAGIEIGLNWTWILVFVLIAWSLAVGVFPDQNPGLSGGVYAVMGILAALLFFVSILLHELGHALQARREGIEIEGITLWLFGGVAQFKGMYESPGAEFRIAIAGPVVTAVIAGVLLAATALFAPATAVDGVIAWLAYINLVLLAFNLIPALPLDGGRVLHSALWRAKHSLVWATRVGTTIGIGFGYLLIGIGIVLFVAAVPFGGIWLALIGWFLTSAARAEARQMLIRQSLAATPVSELMTAAPTTVGPQMPLDRFIDEVAPTSHFTAYPVTEDGQPLGLLTYAAVADAPDERRHQLTAADCMIPRERVLVLRPTDDAAEVLGEVVASSLQRALVVDRDHLVGLLSITDLSRAVATRNGHPAHNGKNGSTPSSN